MLNLGRKGSMKLVQDSTLYPSSRVLLLPTNVIGLPTYIPNVESSIKAKFQKVNPKVNHTSFYQNCCRIYCSALISSFFFLHQPSKYLLNVNPWFTCNAPLHITQRMMGAMSLFGLRKHLWLLLIITKSSKLNSHML